MRWPIPTAPKTIPKGYRFGAPRSSGRKHRGVDLGKMGTPVLAADDGVVTFTGWSKGLGGLMIYIKHAGGWQTRYMHMMTGSILVKKGQKVTAGQQIGKAGSTGITYSAPHLHFETLLDGKHLDPEKVLAGGGLVTVLALAGAAWVVYKVMA
jgi:murein DD-endopeptidase MepM/ murein hydrolase activator NlpD